jgi:hypothetical protein
MAPFIAMFLSIGIATVLGIAAAAFGADSRPGYDDDHLHEPSARPFPS